MIQINEQACIGCGACVRDCFPGTIGMEEGKARLLEGRCISCGHCIAICPVNAVRITEYDMNDVMELGEQNISPEDFLNFVKSRRSIRHYKNQPVDPALIHRMLEAGRFTATGGNRQELSYVVITERMEEFRRLVIEGLADIAPRLLAAEDTTQMMRDYAGRWLKMAEQYRQNPAAKDSVFLGAPVVILVMGNGPVDAGMAVSNMELMAHASGLGALYSGFITWGADHPAVREFLGIPAGKTIRMTLLVGHPDVKYKRNVPRKAQQVTWL